MERCVEVCDMQNAETTLAIIRDRGKEGKDLEDVYLSFRKDQAADAT